MQTPKPELFHLFIIQVSQVFVDWLHDSCIICTGDTVGSSQGAYSLWEKQTSIKWPKTTLQENEHYLWPKYKTQETTFVLKIKGK